jgi:hypothetical protein
MRKLFSFFAVLMVLAILLCISPCPVWSADSGNLPANPGLDDGSQEALADGPFIFTDSTTGTAIYIYQSALNRGRTIRGEIEGMKYYIAPYFIFMTPKAPNITEVGNKVLLTVDVHTYTDGILDQVLEIIRGGLPYEYRSRLSHSNISRMSHFSTSFEIQSSPGISINTIGGQHERVQLQPTQPVTFHIDQDKIETFKPLLAKGQLNISVKVNYMGKDLHLVEMGIGQADKTLTEKALKDVVGGSAFVTADEVVDIVKKVLREKGIYDYRDPYTDEKIMEKLSRILDREMEEHDAFIIRSREDARRIDEILFDGMGLEPNEFLPITTYWDVFEETRNITDIKDREEAVRKSYKKLNGSLTGKIWGVLREFIVEGNAKVDAVKETTDEAEIDKLVSEYLDHFKIRSGKEVVFTARGLDLFETGNVQTLLNSGILIVTIEPYNAIRDYVSIARFQPSRGKIAAFSVRYSKPRIEQRKTYETQTISSHERWRRPDRTGLRHLNEWVYVTPGWKIDPSTITVKCNSWAGWVDQEGTWARMDEVTPDGFHVSGALRLKQEVSNRHGWMKAEGEFIQYVESEIVETEKYSIASGNELNVPIPLDHFGRNPTIDGITVYYEDGSTRIVTYPGAYEDFSYVEKLPRNVIFRAFPHN